MRHAGTIALLIVAGYAAMAYGSEPSFCSGPQNADAFPSKPVRGKESQCHLYQQYDSTSPTAAYGSGCGGYTVAFGPKGALKHPVDGHTLSVDWGDVAPTAANCAASHTEAIAWGYRCDDKACSAGAWEKIGDPKSRAGTWNSVSKVCYVGLNFVTDGKKDYQTVQVDARAYRQQGAAKTAKRVKVRIYAYRHNGKCLSATSDPQKK